jgi:hypothetical protein
MEYHHALYLNFETLAGLWPWAIRPSLKIEILGFFHHHHESSDSYSKIMSHILKIWDFGRIGKWATGTDGHMLGTRNILRAETFRMSPQMLSSDNRNSNYARKSIFFLEEGPG